MKYQETSFDDVVVDDKGNWTQVCSECAEKAFKSEVWDEVPINGLICGVENCNNQAQYYLDFNDKK